MISNDLHIVTGPGGPTGRRPDGDVRGLFQKGEKVHGRVLETNGSGAALVAIKGKVLQVRSGVRLKAGTDIGLVVKKTSPELVLQYLGSRVPGARPVSLAGVLAAVKGNLWKTVIETGMHAAAAGPQEKAALENLWQRMAQATQRPMSPGRLREMVSAGGLGLEAKLKQCLPGARGAGDAGQVLVQDLKGLLSMFIGRLQNVPATFRQLRDILEKIQLVNRGSLESGGKVYIPLPLELPGGGSGVAELLIKWTREQGQAGTGGPGPGRTLKATLLLDFTRLGPVRADFMLREKTVQGRFTVTAEKAQRAIERALPELKKSLGEKGFSVAHAGCVVTAPETVAEPLVKSIWENSMRPEEERALCVVG